MAVDDPRERYAALSAEAIASGDPTAWFERLYSESAQGTARIPWDRAAAHPLLDPPAPSPGTPARALVVGCGLGDDAELISSLGYRTVAFDLSPAAISLARKRFPASTVDYQVADLFAAPAAWQYAFDLVAEVFTVQSLPPGGGLRAAAAEAIGRFTAEDGQLLVIAVDRAGMVLDDVPPWPLTRAEVESFATGGLSLTSLRRHETRPGLFTWRAVFTRDA